MSKARSLANRAIDFTSTRDAGTAGDGTLTTGSNITTTGNATIGGTLGVTGALTGSNAITSTGSAGIGYGTGAGGTVTQSTSKSTTVTLNKTCGRITMNNAALAGATAVGFALSNSCIAATDNIVVNVVGGSVSDGVNYRVWATAQAGAAAIYIYNASGGSLSEAVQINFSVIKGATS